ncbi:MAG: hypothetical protein AAGF12_13260 [Myxococcota bacterium]
MAAALSTLVACAEGSKGDGNQRPGDASVDARRGVDARADRGLPTTDTGRDAALDDATPDADATLSCDPGLTPCGGRCIDRRNDIDHCGGCESLCRPPNAVPLCRESVCAIGSCTPGFADCNGAASDGCEAMVAVCNPGSSCSTSCGSSGTWDCGDACGTPRCVPPAETCNLADDNCNGTCDEGAGCRVAVHRARQGRGYYLTTNLAEASTGGRTLDRTNLFYVYPTMQSGLRPFYRCRKPNGLFFYTGSATCEGAATQLGVLGYVATAAANRCGSVPLFRLYNLNTADHFYTPSSTERATFTASRGYRFEAEAAQVWTTP